MTIKFKICRVVLALFIAHGFLKLVFNFGSVFATDFPDIRTLQGMLATRAEYVKKLSEKQKQEEFVALISDYDKAFAYFSTKLR